MKLSVEIEHFPLRNPFKIAYHTFEDSELIRVEIEADGLVGRGEGGSHPHLQALDVGRDQILALKYDLEHGLTTDELLERMPRGPARNAVDCALWDLKAKQAGTRVWEMLDLPEPEPLTTAYTIGIADREKMIEEALAMSDYAVLKIKVDGSSGFELLEAIAQVRPDAEFIIDANEGWQFSQLKEFVERATALRVRLIEQPLPRDDDKALTQFNSPIPLAADESFHGLPDVERLADRYQAINIKLDKIGGLTEGLQAARAIRSRGLEVMVGCNGGTSLGIAPAYCIGLLASHIDLDSPLLLARDREFALRYEQGQVHAPLPELWG